MEVEKIEKELPTVSFTTSKDSKKYRDKKRKERKIKKEKGIKVSKIKKQVYNSDSENSNDEFDGEDSEDSVSDQEEEIILNKKQKIDSSQPATHHQQQQQQDRLEQDKQALSNKLSGILNSNKKSSTSAPILLKSQQTLNQQIQKEKEKKKAQKEKELEKELLKNKDYKPIEILLTPEERDLLRLAKKGVIKLFNAVTQHQSSGMTASVDSKSKNISKNQFLETLKNSKVKKSNGEESDDSDSDDNDQDGNAEEWDVLKDDYLIKNEWDGEDQD